MNNSAQSGIPTVEPNKDDYDEVLQFSRFTEANWFLPDRKNYMPLRMAKEHWAEGFLSPRLSPTVPLEVLRLSR
jgi:hypothetical protein